MSVDVKCFYLWLWERIDFSSKLRCLWCLLLTIFIDGTLMHEIVIISEVLFLHVLNEQVVSLFLLTDFFRLLQFEHILEISFNFVTLGTLADTLRA